MDQQPILPGPPTSDLAGRAAAFHRAAARARRIGLGSLVCPVLLPGLLLAATDLGVRDTRFTINGEPMFLLGSSYYGALGAPEGFIRQDLNDLQRHGFNWIRVWATWAAFTNDVAAVDGEGRPREPYLGRLASLVAECDRRGMVVDVTLSRGNGVTGPPRLART